MVVAERDPGIHLVVLTRQKSKFKKDFYSFRSRLHFVRCCRPKPAVPAIRWSVTSRSGLEPTDQRSTGLGHHKTARRPRAVVPISRGVLFESIRGLPDIRLVVHVCGLQTAYLCCGRCTAGLVETRRLELLTLSLQRRCSSN